MKIPHILLCLLGLCLPAFAKDLPATLKEGMIFHLPFEGTLEAETAAGLPEPKPLPSGKAEFSEGVLGQGLVLGGDSIPSLSFDSSMNIDLAQGTLSFWVKPLDWSGSDIIPLFLLGVAPKYLGIQVASFSGSPKNLMFFSRFDTGTRSDVTIRGDAEWPEGVWRQVVLTWKDGLVRLYTDRGLASEARIVPPLQEEDISTRRFRFGEAPGVTSVIDEVRIWNRALSEEEIGALQNVEEPQ